MQDFEKLGVFYLGREYDLEAGRTGETLVLYDSRDLVTHAVCVGMTGSGKTGLCLALLEEAALDGIPVIAIDPKGDLGNLLLTFPELRGEDFAPWVDPDEAGGGDHPASRVYQVQPLALVKGGDGGRLDAGEAVRIGLALATDARRRDLVGGG